MSSLANLGLELCLRVTESQMGKEKGKLGRKAQGSYPVVFNRPAVVHGCIGFMFFSPQPRISGYSVSLPTTSPSNVARAVFGNSCEPVPVAFTNALGKYESLPPTLYFSGEEPETQSSLGDLSRLLEVTRRKDSIPGLAMPLFAPVL